MTIESIENSEEDNRLIRQNKKRGLIAVIGVGLISFAIMWVIKPAIWFVTFFPLLSIFIYFILFKNEKVKTVYTGKITRKSVDKKDVDDMPKYNITLDNQQTFDFFGVPRDDYWDKISAGDLIEIHKANGVIFHVFNHGKVNPQ